MSTVWPAQIISRILRKEEDVEYMFGVHGGHTMPFDDWFCMDGGKYIHMRHEQGGVFAADAYARITRKPSVAFGTSGPGVANMTGAIGQAYTAKSPVVCLLGQHPLLGDDRWALQESYGSDMMRRITKASYRAVTPAMIGFYVKKAFRVAAEYPQGPVAVEIPLDVLNWNPVELEQQAGYTPDWRSGPAPVQVAQPDLVEKTVNMLLSAERPLIIAGEGIHWSDAAVGLREFVELTGIPVHTRRIARGAVPEDHPLHIEGGYRGRFLKNADLIVVIGLRMGYLEGYGAWNDTAKFIQINEASSEICLERKTELEIIGNPKMILKQMIDCAGSIGKPFNKRAGWVSQIEEGRVQWREKQRREVEPTMSQVPVHPHAIGQVLANYLNNVIPEASVVFDSYTGTNYMTDKISSRFSGRIIDSAEWGGIGHGVPMAIGAQLARPGKPVLSYIGDGGMGVSGFDIETAARYDLPIVYVMYNNGVWIAGEQKFAYGPNWKVLGPQNFHGRNNDKGERYRYDRVFKEFGCHVEHVTKAGDLTAALDRSFSSGKTSVINMETSPDVYVKMFERPDWACMFWHIPKDRFSGSGWDQLNNTYKGFHGTDIPDTEKDF
jgi:acetolactate synthase-1/2/3 large subunit